MFALRPNALTRAIEKTIFSWLPYFQAAIEFRRGNLLRAQKLSSNRQRSSVYMRATEMLDILDGRIDLESRLVPSCADNLELSADKKGPVLFVLHSAPNFDPNGYGVRTEQMLNSLVGRGCKVLAATRLGYPWDLDRHAQLERTVESHWRGHIFRHRFDPGRGISGLELQYASAYGDYLVDLIQENDVRLLHCHSNFLNGLAGMKASRVAGVPLVYEMRGLWHLSRSTTEPGYQRSEHFAYCEFMELEVARISDRVVANSNALSDWLIKKGVDSRKITVVANTVEFEHAVPRGHISNMSARGLHIGYVGALTHYEGLDTLVKSIAVLRDGGVVAKLTLAGHGPYERQLHKLVEELKLTREVQFLGRISRDEVLSIYQEIDVCALPRSRYPVTELIQPLKPFEIMLNRIPLIVSDLPPLLEIVEPESRGLVCRAGNAESLAECFEYVLKNTGIVNQMSQRAYESVVNSGGWDKNGHVLEQMYAALCEGKK